MRNEPPIVGLDDVSLSDVWESRPQAYLAVCVPKLPNFYLYFGPNGGPGSGSAIVFLENVAEYIVKNVQKIQREYLKSMVVKEQPTTDFVNHVDAYFAKTVFVERVRPTLFFFFSNHITNQVLVQIVVQAQHRRWSRRRSVAGLLHPRAKGV
jgi:hypothetical protein